MSPETKKKIFWIVFAASAEGAIAGTIGYAIRGPDPMSAQMRACNAVTDCIATHPNKLDMTLSCGNAIYKMKALHDKSKELKEEGK